MTNQEQSSAYLLDLGFLVKELALSAKLERDGDRKELGANFEAGRLSAFYDVVSLMQQQAVAFNIDLEALALGGLDPDRDLV